VARLFPQLEVLELIGKGGMGAIYKVRQRSLDRLAALKILPVRQTGSDAFAERFNREARALARLNHPNIVALYEFGQVEGLHYFLMEYVDGVNLRQLLQRNRLSPRQDMELIPQICDALQYAHDAGVVHRDVKPENVLVDRKGRVKIADFGLAKLVGVEPQSLRLTLEGEVMGTPHYMAPEQVEHPLEVDHRADIYALGVVFYEMLTGELPLGKFSPPSCKVEVDLRLDEVVLRALEKEPERRYQQAAQVKTAVEGIAHTPPPTQPTAAPADRPGGVGAPAAAESDSWRRLRHRFWPPVVCRQGSERFINWPAVAMRGLRVLLVGISGAIVCGVAFGNMFGPKRGLVIAFAELAFVYGMAFLVLAIRVLRGLAAPLDLLPEYKTPPAKVSEARHTAPDRGRRAGMAGFAVFLLIFALAAVLTNIQEQSYVGIARVELHKAGAANEGFDPYFFQTQAEKVRSIAIAEEVVDRLSLTNSWGPRFGAQTKEAGALLLQRSLEVRQARNTFLLEIRFFSADASEAAEVANAVAEAFRQHNSEMASIVDRAVPGLRPVRPNIAVNLFLGAFAGTGLGAITGAIVFLATPRRARTHNSETGTVFLPVG
jgi:predicted Ser/Thr protein kinase